MKTCKRCKIEKEDECFYFKAHLNRLYTYCIECTKEMDKQTRTTFKVKNNSCKSTQWKYSSPTNKSRVNELERIRKQKTKLHLIAGYGGKCSCCGETNSRFLTLEHLKKDGQEHREKLTGNRQGGGYKIYKDVIERGFPSDYTVLCMNCNFSEKDGLVCPHKIDRSKELSIFRSFIPNMN